MGRRSALARYNVVLLTALLTSCSPPTAQDTRGGKRSDAGSEDCGAASLNLVDGAGGKGSIAFSLSDNTDPCSVEGYVVGSADSSSVQRTDANAYVINDVGAGEQDFIVTGTTSADSGRATIDPTNISGANLSDTAVAAGTVVGLRVNDVTVEAGLASQRSIRLSPVGAIVGAVKLSGQTDHTGIDVYIPGTRYIAKTDASGAYRLDSVPPGTHNLRFEYTGYGTAVLEGVEVLTSATTTAPEMLLVTGSGEGKIQFLDANNAVIPGDIPTLSSRTVKYLLQVTGSPRLMKVAEDGNFANLEWQPFRSIGTYVFKNDIAQGGRVTRRLSIRTLEGATEGELEKAVVIDLYPEIRGQQVMTVAATNDAGPSLTITAQITVPQKAVEMRVSLREDFVGAIWKPVASTASIKVEDEGDYTLYLQLRDVDLVLSDVFASPVTVDLFPAGSVAFTVSSPSIRFPDTPAFALSSITTPLTGSAVKLLVADNAGLTGATEYAQAAVLTHTLGDKASACGTTTLYVAPTYTDPATGRRYVSDVRPSQTVAYDCIRSYAAFPAAMNADAAIGYDNGKVFVWSGGRHTQYIADYGYILDVATGGWTPINSSGQPAGRRGAAVWATGNKFVVFGGVDEQGYGFWDGGIYDPSTSSWTTISPPPSVRNDLGSYCDELDEQLDGPAYFTGTHIIVWGNQDEGLDDCSESVGYVYNVATSTWAVMPDGGPAIRCDYLETRAPGVVVGGKLFVYTGLDCADDDETIDDAWVYEAPKTGFPQGVWTAVDADGAGGSPSKRFDHVRVASGNLIYVFGGRKLDDDDEPTAAGMDNGAVYDVANDVWTAMDVPPTSVNLSPLPETLGLSTPVAGMIGGKLVIWSGFQGELKRWQGLVYDPSQTSGQRWSYISTADAPRYVTQVIEVEGTTDRITGDGALITAERLYVWSRASTSAELDNLSVNLLSAYDPVAKSWTKMPTGKRQLASGVEHSFYRNFVQAFATTAGVLFFGGDTPKDVPVADVPQASAVLHYND